MSRKNPGEPVTMKLSTAQPTSSQNPLAVAVHDPSSYRSSLLLPRGVIQIGIHSSAITQAPSKLPSITTEILGVRASTRDEHRDVRCRCVAYQLRRAVPVTFVRTRQCSDRNEASSAALDRTRSKHPTSRTPSEDDPAHSESLSDYSCNTSTAPTQSGPRT